MRMSGRKWRCWKQALKMHWWLGEVCWGRVPLDGFRVEIPWASLHLWWFCLVVSGKMKRCCCCWAGARVWLPDVVQGCEKGLAKVLLLLTALPGKLRQRGCDGWGLSLVWSCVQKFLSWRSERWEAGEAAPTLPFHPTSHTSKVMISRAKCPWCIRDEQKTKRD